MLHEHWSSFIEMASLKYLHCNGFIEITSLNCSNWMRNCLILECLKLAKFWPIWARIITGTCAAVTHTNCVIANSTNYSQVLLAVQTRAVNAFSPTNDRRLACRSMLNAASWVEAVIDHSRFERERERRTHNSSVRLGRLLVCWLLVADF